MNPYHRLPNCDGPDVHHPRDRKLAIGTSPTRSATTANAASANAAIELQLELPMLQNAEMDLFSIRARGEPSVRGPFGSN